MANNLTAIISADTSKFTSSINSAKELLAKYSKEAKGASDAISKNCSVTESQVSAYQRVIKQLDKVSSGTLTTSQSVKTLENQIKELKIQWANLSDEAKKGDFGKSISQSISSASESLKTMKKQLSQTSEQIKKTDKSIGMLGGTIGSMKGILGKICPAVGATTIAFESLKKIIGSTQTTSDAFAATMYSTKTAVNELFYAISTFDFSAFDEGLKGIIQKGKDAADAIDQLGNTILSYNVKSAKANQKLARARAVFYDPDSTKEEKEKAKKDMEDALNELKASAEVMLTDYQDAIIKEVNSKGGSLTGDDALNILDKWLEIDTTAGRESAKEKAKTDYEAYQKKLEELQNKYTSVYSQATTWGTSWVTQTDYNNPEYLKQLSALKDEYKDSIAYHTLLEKYTDEELANLGQQRIAMININSQVDQYSSTMNKLNTRADSTTNKTSTSNTPVKEDIFEEGSLRDAQKKVAELQDKLNRMSPDNEAFEQTKIELEEAKKLVEEIQNKLSTQKPVTEKSKIELYDDYSKDIRNIQREYEIGLIVDADEADRRIKEINDKIVALGLKPIEIKLKVEESEADKKVREYEDSYRKIQDIQKKYQIGAIDKEQSLKDINEINKRLQALGLKPIEVELDVKVEIPDFKDQMNEIGGIVSGFDSMVGSIDGVYRSFRNLEDELDNAENGWESFMAVFNSVMSVINAGVNIINTITEVTSAFNAITQALTASKEAEAGASTAATAAKMSEAGASATATVASESAAAASTAETTANAGAAITGVAKSVGAIPYIGPILAVAAVASLVAAFASSLGKFATGGIVGGGNNVGDYNLARVNGGEMILNGTQQKKLFGLLNGSESSNPQFAGGQVEFKIRGDQLVGVINNYNRKREKV